MIISLLGAESTGKSTLAAALHRHLQAAAARLTEAEASPAITHVPEYLRTWCAQHGRNPRQDEQLHIACTQAERLTDAARHTGGTPSWVIADTTPLMTAVYSDHYFGDDTLYPLALRFHDTAMLAQYAPPAPRTPRGADGTVGSDSSGSSNGIVGTLGSDGINGLYGSDVPHNSADTGLHPPPLTLLMGLDLPWQADGAMRDGPAAQLAVDALLRQQLAHWYQPFQTIYGDGAARVAAALQAIASHLARHLARHLECHPAEKAHTTAWQEAIEKEANYSIRESGRGQKSIRYTATCDCCDDTASERQTFSRLLASRVSTGRQ